MTVHNLGHLLKSISYLLFVNNSVVQPIGDMLTGNSHRGAIFHQVQIGNIGHLGAADSLVDPAHHIAENSLRIVFQLPNQVTFLDVAPIEQRNTEDIVQAGAPA